MPRPLNDEAAALHAIDSEVVRAVNMWDGGPDAELRFRVLEEWWRARLNGARSEPAAKTLGVNVRSLERLASRIQRICRGHDVARGLEAPR